MQATYVLVHSPSVGPATWLPVAGKLGRAVVPDLTAVGTGAPPYWPRVVEAVRSAVPDEGPLVLVAHSNAGLFVPVIKEGLGERVVACVFADAHLPPRSGLVKVAGEEFLPFLRELAGPGGVLPRWSEWWSESDVVAMLPDPVARERVVAEQARLPLAYYTQLVPVPAGWDAVPCGCLWYGPPYDEVAEEAAGRGWPVTRVPGGHLQQVTDPGSVAEALLKVVNSSLFPAR
ncbi:alpha/beta fold hydrolase [Nonomuraea typhae]|uniref:alpha/beta fold hydrolase n=1 Tax=Nonomuraea typhae TaxID=2603600 RepID=UPI0012FC4877|nr:alpha/beta fold hydrolase [Nonomuraea typhae]